jgi:ribosomal protein S18 acetylase RimI-like enzyme
MNPLRPLAFWRRKAALALPDAGDGVALASPLRAPESEARAAVRQLPRPALRWVGPAGRIALRSFDFATDAEAVCAFQEETYTLNFPDFRYTDAFASAFRHDLRRAALDPNHVIYVLDEGRVCGFLWLVICENSWTRERYGYINNLYLVPERRGQGLARELMRQADLLFRSRRIRRVRLTVTAANAEAVQLYEQCGYDVTRWEMEKTLEP